MFLSFQKGQLLAQMTTSKAARQDDDNKVWRTSLWGTQQISRHESILDCLAHGAIKEVINTFLISRAQKAHIDNYPTCLSIGVP